MSEEIKEVQEVQEVQGEEVHIDLEIANETTYTDFISKFGSSKIDEKLLKRIEEVTGKRPHRFLRRGLFYSHRDLVDILDAYESGKTIYIYTGRGPSSESLHLGHMIPFIFTQYLQEAFNAICVVQVTDDEKFLRDRNLTQDDTFRFTKENIKDMICCGFDIEKTFTFIDSQYISQLYPTTCRIEKEISVHQIKKVFGFDDSMNVGYFSFPPKQIAPSFPTVFPHIFGMYDPKDVYCLIPCGIEQDPYFRICRDIAVRLGFNKPALIHSKFIPSLRGAGKMSATTGKEGDTDKTNSTIFMTDTPKQIKTKINKYAYSGGGKTIEEHRKYGANIDVDISVKYLEVFMEDDDELERIKTEYKKGNLLTGEVKAILVKILQDFVLKHQETRKNITDEILNTFISVRKMKLD